MNFRLQGRNAPGAIRAPEMLAEPMRPPESFNEYYNYAYQGNICFLTENGFLSNAFRRHGCSQRKLLHGPCERLLNKHAMRTVTYRTRTPSSVFTSSPAVLHHTLAKIDRHSGFPLRLHSYTACK